MNKIIYKKIEEDSNESATDIAFHNMEQGDKIYNLKLFLGGQSGYFEANPTKTMQDLEKELRDRNFGTHIIARPPSNIIKNCKLGIPGKGTSDTTEYKYECIVSCRPSEYALTELLQSWNSYEENFEALKLTGMMIVTSESQVNEEACSNERLEVFEESNPVNLVAKNKAKATLEYQSVSDVVSDITKSAKDKLGKEPTMQMRGISHNGGQIYAFVVDNKTVSNIGLVFSYDKEGKQVMNLFDLNTLQK